MNYRKKQWILFKLDNKPCLTKKDLHQLDILSVADESTVRCDAAEILAYCNKKGTIELLFHLAFDKNSLVRVQAYESLASFPQKKVKKFLEGAAFHEKNDLGLAYIIESWVDIVCARERVRTEDYLFLKKLKKKKRVYKSERCILAIHYAEYMIGKTKSWKKIKNAFNSENYRIRCTVVNLFANIISYDNRKEIRKMLKEMRRKETTVAVKSTIDKLLNETA